MIVSDFFNSIAQSSEHTEPERDMAKVKCEICLKIMCKSSLGPQALGKHMRIHNDERPFECNVCAKKFHTKENLTAHKRIHTGERPFKCDICDRKFKQSGHLIGHKRIHTGEEPYECDVCLRKFTQNSNLQTH